MPTIASAATNNAVVAIATTVPSAMVREARRHNRLDLSTRPVASAASGAYSGPSTIAPTMSTNESVRIPMAAIHAAATSSRQNAVVSPASDSAANATSSHTTASAASPGARALASSAEIGHEDLRGRDRDCPDLGHTERRQTSEHGVQRLTGDIGHQDVSGRVR